MCLGRGGRDGAGFELSTLCEADEPGESDLHPGCIAHFLLKYKSGFKNVSPGALPFTSPCPDPRPHASDIGAISHAENRIC